MKILIVDQFSGITPFWLQQNSVRFDDLVAQAEVAISADERWGFTVPSIQEVAPTWTPGWGQTALCEGKDGLVEIWKSKWDTSG